MASDNRIRGQEVTVLFSIGDEIQQSLNDISDFSFSYMFEIMSKGYLGQKSEKKSTIFKGIKGSFNADVSSQDLFRLAESVRQKATNEAPDTAFTITGVLSFPDGSTPAATFRDVALGEIPINAANRAEFVKVTINFECPDVEVNYG